MSIPYNIYILNDLSFFVQFISCYMTNLFADMAEDEVFGETLLTKKPLKNWLLLTKKQKTVKGLK